MSAPGSHRIIILHEHTAHVPHTTCVSLEAAQLMNSSVHVVVASTPLTPLDASRPACTPTGVDMLVAASHASHILLGIPHAATPSQPPDTRWPASSFIRCKGLHARIYYGSLAESGHRRFSPARGRLARHARSSPPTLARKHLVESSASKCTITLEIGLVGKMNRIEKG